MHLQSHLPGCKYLSLDALAIADKREWHWKAADGVRKPTEEGIETEIDRFDLVFARARCIAAVRSV